jgi:hypothetical protein
VADLMTDQTVGLAARPSLLRLRALARQCLWPAALRPAMAWALQALIIALLGYHFWEQEGEWANILFTAAVTSALIAMVIVLARRALFATALVASLVAMIVLVASVKRATMNMVVHAYDFIFYLSSWSTLTYLWSDQRRYVVGFAGILLAAAMTGVFSYRLDSTRVPRHRAALLAGGCVLLAWCGACAKSERRHMQFYFEDLYVSSFYASWGETIEALWRGALIEAAPHTADGPPPFTIQTCHPFVRPPHIILIHEESLVQPALFAGLSYDHAVDPLFQSSDDQLHRLRVETYGGASWLTEFSLLAGVSSRSFGGMRQFVQTFTQNRLKDTLPQALERCGYRNVVFYPLMRNFVSNDKFYTSIALNEIFDMSSQGAITARERDKVYFENALAEMARHIKSSRKPLFTYIQTMSAHWPYSFKYEPDVDVPGGAPGTDEEMSEYLRRVAMAKLDFDGLTAALAERFPHEHFLIVHYGDHHPLATRTLLGFQNETQAEDVTLDFDSPGFITYYAARGINYPVPVLPPFETLDVAYLGTLALDLAGLPLSDSHRERKRLMMLCKGRYYGCARREEILLFHRRLIDSGIIAAY